VRGILLSAVAIPGAIFTIAATITATAVYAIVAMVLGVALLLFFLLAFRGIALRIEWGKKKKKIWFERIPPPEVS